MEVGQQQPLYLDFFLCRESSGAQIRATVDEQGAHAVTNQVDAACVFDPSKLLAEGFHG
jgi:hypothetical protein